MLLNNLANAYLSHYGVSSQMEDLEQAISTVEAAMALTPEGDPQRADRMATIGNSYLTLFMRSHKRSDIDKAISSLQAAVDIAPDEYYKKSGFLNNLGNAYQQCFDNYGDVSDIRKGIKVLWHITNLTPDGHPEKHIQLGNLGAAYHDQFEQTGQLAEIERAVEVLELAVQCTEKGSMNAMFPLSNLGVALEHRFEHVMEVKDIDRAILLKQTALSLIPKTHKHVAGLLSNLGNSFLLRYERLENATDIEQAIQYHQEAVEKTDDSSAQMTISLSNLGGAYQCHYQHAKDVTDLQEAISCYQRAIAYSADGLANMAAQLNNHGTACFEYAQHTGLVSYLDEGIMSMQQAVDLVPEGHAMKPAYLRNLANAYFYHYQQDEKNVLHAEKAIELLTHAVHLTPEHHARKVECYHDLGNMFFVQYQHTLDKNDLHFAIVYHHSAATAFTGSITTRFAAAKMWAHCAHQDASLQNECLDAYSWACSLLPQVIWLGLNMTEQYAQIISLSDFVNEAASMAIILNKLEIAVEWLEQGRSVVWNQLLQLRASYQDLDEQYPELAKELKSVAQALEKASMSKPEAGVAQSPIFLHEAAAHHHQLAQRWETLLRDIQAKPGFHTFLKPKSFEEIYPACKNGPIIMVNVHRMRCDALVLVCGQQGVLHVPLSAFSNKMASDFQYALHATILQSNIQQRETRQTRQAKFVSASAQSEHSLREILAELWHHVAWPIIQALGLQCLPDEQKPHCWWCVTGPLAMLPIHAAGVYESSLRLDDQVSSYMVSSYTPTLTSLANSLHAAASEFQGLLMITQPETPGQAPLYFANEEQSVVMRHMNKYDHDHALSTYLSGSRATIEAVLDDISTCSWIHLACHGTQNLKEPIKSAFCLHDGFLELSTLITKSIPHAELAFLSACQTATGTPELSEEAVHLAAGMLFAGFKSVIATMWSIRDEDAPVVTNGVYSYLCKDQRPQGTMSALALHMAVNRLREEIGTMDNDAALLAWVPFIHVGL
ncbi:TPR-like protein [Fomitopsis serialis]|uniref:TPR-like protein n=1 Tax=Fomitopsis serialis TaxID=139415 RepID=UPI002008825F|nr:TPR-like protein [Neoantrodia serialis]KAH9911557.1 TPR-like protein [Neoantrodia serialis]